MLLKSNSVKCWLWLKAIEMPHLCFSQHKRCGHFKAFRSGQVFVKFELVLQFQQLLTGEGSAGPPALAQQAGLRARCINNTEINGCVRRKFIRCDNTNHSFIYFLNPSPNNIIFSGSGKYCLFNTVLKRLPTRIISAQNLITHNQGREKFNVIFGVWDMQAHICPHSAAIINYNGFTWVYCWRGEQGRSECGGNKSRGMPLT